MFPTSVSDDINAESILKVASCNSAEMLQEIQDERPDFAVVFGTGKLSVDQISDGMINVHPGIAQKKCHFHSLGQACP